MKWIVLFLALLVACANIPNKKCQYDDNYIGKNAEECSRVQVLCIPGYERFDNECGCGCRPTESNQTYCNPDQRQADVCIALYQPVCGWFSEDVKCIKYPCAQTFGNSCEACKDEKVSYYTEGECPI